MKYLLLAGIIICSSGLFAQKDSSHFFRSFDGTMIYYEDTGAGIPVLLIHGFLNTSQNWKRTAVYKDLISAGYRVIILDLRGNGKSDKPHSSASYADDAEAKDVEKLVSLLRLSSYNVIGYSRGSIIASRLLVMDKRIKTAVLGGMGTDFTNPDWPRRIMFYHLLNGDTTVQELMPLVKRLQTDSTLDRQSLTMQQKEQPSTSVALLQKVSQPVLVVCGTEDADNGKGKDLAALFRRGKFVSVPGNHGFAVTTKEFSDSVLNFLESQSKQINK